MDPDREREALREALGRVADGDGDALKFVYDRTCAKLFGVCARILGEPSEAEDVLQEVYIKVWRHADGFDRARGSPITWLAAIARNRAIDRVRARRGARPEPIEAADHVADATPLASDALVEAERRDRLGSCLDKLESAQREAVRTAFLEGCAYETLARRAGVPLGTMKSWIRRSLLRLRICLEQ